MIENKRTRNKIVHTMAHLLLILSCLLFLLPILYTFSVSLRSSNSLVTSTFSLIPENATLDNFKNMLLEKPFFTWLKNSFFLSISTVILALLISSPAAYAFSRFRFRTRGAILYLLLLLNAFPAILSMVAIYRLFRVLNLMNTYTGLIIAYTGAMIIFSIWNLKGYFDSIPVEIEQAAMIDGATNLNILWSIVLPLARPAIIVTGMMVFITSWNEYIYAVNFLTGSEHYTLAAGLYSLQGTDYTRNWPLFASGSLIVSLPVLIVFFAIQKYLVSGLTAGGVKY